MCSCIPSILCVNLSSSDSSVTIYGVEMGKRKHKSLKTDKASYKTDRKKERSKRSRKKKKRVDRKKHKGHKEHGEWKSLVY